MLYLCLSFSVLWSLVFGYLVNLDKQVRDIRKRLDVRTSAGVEI